MLDECVQIAGTVSRHAGRANTQNMAFSTRGAFTSGHAKLNISKTTSSCALRRDIPSQKRQALDTNGVICFSASGSGDISSSNRRACLLAAVMSLTLPLSGSSEAAEINPVVKLWRG